MQNNFITVATHAVRQKYILAIFLAFIFVLPSQVIISAEYEAQSSPPLEQAPLKVKKPKINKITDLRILVDISGSMKKTDPNNLRRSAVRLLASLIPEGTRAGIWNFGKQVNMAVKVGVVNDAWRELAHAESKKISSVGLYTNIEDALRKVSFDWKKENLRYNRNLIILTDGHVDISKNDQEDKASRRRILKEIIPALEQAKVQVHSIALSDDVDERLLTTLSAYTDGLYKKVKSANDLQKLFLQMLEQSIKLDTLPIINNSFNVDASINDMTLLIFNSDKNNPTKIITPENTSWEKSSQSNQVKWFGDDGYDLITIKKPKRGKWKIKAPSDNNNRVVVATNLKLKVNELPGSLKIGDVLNVEAYLEEDGKPLTDQRMLSKFKFILKRKSERSAERIYPFIKSDENSSKYSVQLAPIFKLGDNEIVIQAKSQTVEREIHHQFKVYTEPHSLNLVNNDEAKSGEKNIREGHKTTDTHKINNTHTKKTTDKVEKSYDKLKSESPNEHKVEGSYKPSTKNSDEKGEVEKKDEIDWIFIGIAIVIGNLLLIGILVGGFFFVKRRKAKLIASLDNDNNKEEEPKEEEKKEAKEEKQKEK